MRKQMYFILLSVIFFFCLKGQTVYAEETPLQVEDNWLTREVAKQVKKSDVKTLTQEDFEKITSILVYFNTKYYIETIPKEVALLKNLQYLLIDNKNLNVLPDELFTLSKLKYLEISSNKLTEIPTGLFKLKQLERLDLGHNKIKELPKEIGQLSNLEMLSLNGNNLNGIPNEIFLLTSLISLDLSNANLGTIPENISCFENLQTLKLNNNSIKEIPKFIGKLTNLKHLSLDFNFIQELPIEIGNLTNMNTLSLTNNKIGEFPKAILKLTKLSQLSLNNNYINQIPEEISNLSNLISFIISGNKLTTIPKSIGTLSKLWQLGLSDNKIIEIPNTISKLVKLSRLLLAENNITEIPDCISKMTGLGDLSLRGNKISVIPKTIGEMIHLETLYLDNNEITSIPDSIGKMIHLKSLSLNNNKISYIPFEYTVKNGVMTVQDQHIVLPLKKVALNSSLEINCIKPVTQASIRIKSDGIYNKDKNTISWNIKTNTDNQLTYTFDISYKNNGYTTFTGTVTQPIKIEGALTGISLKKSEVNLQVGKSALNSVIYNPEDTIDDKAVTWTSSNKKIATVTSKGKITGVSSGSAIVTAQVGKFTATCKVTVKDDSKPTENKIYFTDDYESKTVTKEETIRIPIKLSTIKDYYALDSLVKYDKTKLEFLGYSIKENYKDCYADSSDVDTLRFILASKGKNYPIKTSDGPIIYLNFKCIAVGDANVTITSTTLANLDEEVAIKTDNLDKTTIHITESSKPSSPDINKDGKFSLIDLAIDAYYYGVDADETDKTKYDADIIPDGKIDDLDLMEITKNIINNK